MNAVPARRPAVFLDRDGTINVEVDYLRRVEDLVLIPGAGRAIARLNRAGYPVIAVTNQSGIARGLLDEPTLKRIHDRLEELLAADGAHLDAIYFCPHHPDHGDVPYRRNCDCRKPAPGLLLRAAEELGLELAGSWVVGDSLRDLEAGRAAGASGILVETGKGVELPEGAVGWQKVAGLEEAVELILGAEQ